MPLTPADVERLRQETPGCAARNHLNNAGAALMPRAVLAVLDRGPRLAAIVTVAVPGCEPEWLLASLRSRAINASIARRGAALYDFSRKGVDWALRLSPHVDNTEDEIDAAVAAVAELAASGD